MPWSRAGGCRREMQARGMRLDKKVEPTIFYVGFNMDDPVVGAPAGERGRKLRQAMSLAIDAKQYLELFLNGRGVLGADAAAAGDLRLRRQLQEPLPPARPGPRAASCSPRPATRTASTRPPPRA